MERVIFHCDCNSFFASVELLHYPQLRDVPVAVCGDPTSRHGVIFAKNEAAKRFGVQTAETVYAACRKCPDLHLLRPHHEEYRRMSRVINAIYARYTDLVEPFGIDESWLDMTGSWHLFGQSPAEVADALRDTVRTETGLTISVGVSFNKVFAKLGSDYRKPDATTVIFPEDVERIVHPLPVEALLYVGKSVCRTLHAMGIRTIGQAAHAEEEALNAALGKAGRQLSLYARGLEDSPVRPAGQAREIKTVGNGMTFRRDLTAPEEIRAGLQALSDEVASRLREKGLYASAVQVVIKDPAFHSISRQAPLNAPTCVGRELAEAALELVRKSTGFRTPIRMLTVTAMQLTDTPDSAQLSMFEPPGKAQREKRERLERSMDAIRQKYGKHAIASAYVLKNDIGLRGLEIQQGDEEI